MGTCWASAAACLLALLMLGACSGATDKSKVAQAINQGLVGTPVCYHVPVGVPIVSRGDHKEVAGSLALKELLAQGLVKPGSITFKDFMGPGRAEGYVVTEAGAALVQTAPVPNAFTRTNACMAFGHWKVRTIEAIDSGSDVSGRPVANVRASIEWVARDWLQATRAMPAWAPYWQDIARLERSQWLYRLLKSGDDYFFTGPGQKLK